MHRSTAGRSRTTASRWTGIAISTWGWPSALSRWCARKWAMQIPVGWMVAIAAGVAYNNCNLEAVEEARTPLIVVGLTRYSGNPSPREGQ
jgi:hypothetical protein